nr:hypothetical protein GCM10020092_044540 [Actinoplanes digitatis]
MSPSRRPARSSPGWPRCSAQGGLWWARRGGGAFAAKFDGTGERRLRAGGGRATIAESRVGVIPVAPNLTAADEAIAAPLGAVASIVDWDVHAALLVADGTLDLALQTRGGRSGTSPPPR